MNAPDKTTISLAAGNVLTLTASADVEGTITEIVQSIPETPVDLADGLTKGPFATPRTFAIVLTVGTLSYEIAPDVPVSRAEYEALEARVTAIEESLE